MPLLLAMLLFALEPPEIRQWGVVNAASQRPASLGGRIAPGTVVAIHGVGFAAVNRVVLRVAGKDSLLPVVSAQAKLVEAWVPPGTPIGSGQLTVEANGQTSKPAAVEIHSNSLGFYSRNGQGWGPADELLATGSAGMREVYVGGKRARVSAVRPAAGHRKRLEIVMAKGTPEGCNVPVYGVLGDAISNTVTIRVGRTERDCKGRDGRGAWMMVTRALKRELESDGEYQRDEAHAVFLRVQPGESSVFEPPPGTCTTFAQQASPAAAAMPMFGRALIAVNGEPVDPGGVVAIHDLRNKVQLGPMAGGGGYYRRELSGRDSSVTLDKPVFMSVSGWVGPVRFSPPSPFELLDVERLRTVARGQPLTIGWKGARGEAMQVILSAISENGSAGMTFCIARAGEGGLTIPAALLAHLPGGRGTLSLAASTRGEVPALPKGFDFLNAYSVFLREIDVMIP